MLRRIIVPIETDTGVNLRVQGVDRGTGAATSEPRGGKAPTQRPWGGDGVAEPHESIPGALVFGSGTEPAAVGLQRLSG